MKWSSSLLLLASLAPLAAVSDLQVHTVETLASSRAAAVYGTELFLLDNEYRAPRAYRFEDFFWTGSGDGPEEDDYSYATTTETTIYQTTTVTSTLYLEPTTTRCSFNCEEPSTAPETITPTPTLETTTPDEYFDADRQFWLLTVLKSNGKDPVLIDLKNSLARLYRAAFQRQQERHLGVRRAREAPREEPVRVHVHSVEKSDGKIEVLYHVAVAGRPVDAVTAAEDMALVSDAEVQAELGYPFLIKAQPYLKPALPESLSRENNTWVFIGAAIVGLLVVLLLMAFLTLALTKRKRAPSPSSGDNRRHIFERGISGEDNAGFKAKEHSPTYINYGNQERGISGQRTHSSLSSGSSSCASIDISPLMTLKRQATPPRKPPRPKAAVKVKRIAPELLDSDSDSKRDSPDTIFAENCDPGVMSPKSYLSMPSVKAFPRGAMPEPLNKVLEPVSVLHLDLPDDTPRSTSKLLTRHGSVGAVADPGVIGPIVWSMHCQRLQHGVSVDEGMHDLKAASNVSRMRKRFHDLLDDTFSLFGSRRESPLEEDARPPVIEVKSRSAISCRPGEEHAQARQRPKTTDLRRPAKSPGSGGPKGAWASAAPSPLIRPLSADFRRKQEVCVEHVLAEGTFKEGDPALPLIAAIKSEIERCSLPGSTADLRN